MALLRSIPLLALSLGLAACQPDPAPASIATPASPAATGTVPTGPVTWEADHSAALAEAQVPMPDLGEFRIVSVLLGNALDGDKIVLGDRDVFAAGDTIHASVLSSGAHQGLRLSAKWLAPDGTTIAESSQPVVPTAGTATTFTISNPTRWPAGEYQVLIGVNGRTFHSEKFNVR